jgi:hypothetical protein
MEAPTTLFDSIIPAFDFGHRQEIVIDAPHRSVAAALAGYEPARDSSRLARLLFRLRGLRPPDDPSPLREALTREGFRVLAERPGEEIVFGVAGRFWALDEAHHLIAVPDAPQFRAFAVPGTAKAAMTLRIEPMTATRSRLVTETRVACADGAAYRRFALYWLLIKPFSAWLRWDMLRAIARRSIDSGARGAEEGSAG